MFLHGMDEDLFGEGEECAVKRPTEGDRILDQKIDLVEEWFVSEDSAGNSTSPSIHLLFDPHLPLRRIDDHEGFSCLLKIGMKIVYCHGSRMHEPVTAGDISAADISYFKRNDLSPEERQDPVNRSGESDGDASPSHRFLERDGKDHSGEKGWKKLDGQSPGLFFFGTDILALL